MTRIHRRWATGLALLMAIVVLLGVYLPPPFGALVRNAANFVDVKP